MNSNFSLFGSTIRETINALRGSKFSNEFFNNSDKSVRELAPPKNNSSPYSNSAYVDVENSPTRSACDESGRGYKKNSYHDEEDENIPKLIDGSDNPPKPELKEQVHFGQTQKTRDYSDINVFKPSNRQTKSNQKQSKSPGDLKDKFDIRLKAIMRIIVTLILLAISIFLLIDKSVDSKTLPCSIISAVTGYWLK